LKRQNPFIDNDVAVVDKIVANRGWYWT